MKRRKVEKMMVGGEHRIILSKPCDGSGFQGSVHLELVSKEKQVQTGFSVPNKGAEC